MINLLSTIAIILILAAAFTKLFDIFINHQTKEDIKQKVENFWVRLDDKNPIILVQAPLIFLASSYNTIFGTRCFSKKSITRSFILSIALLVISLSVTGVFTGTPFGMKTLPWEYFDKMIKFEKLMHETRLDKSDIKDEKAALISKEYSEQRWKYISQFNSNSWRVLYSIFFIFFILVINAIIDTISFSFSRLMLNEMIQIRSMILLLSVFCLNAFISIFIATIVLFLSMLLAMPSISGTAIQLAINLLIKEPSWASIGLFAAAIGAWNLSGGWFKVLALTTILPSIVFCITIFISVLINPVRVKFYKLLRLIILKAVEHDKGVFAFFTVFFTSVGVIIGVIVKYFSN